MTQILNSPRTPTSSTTTRALGACFATITSTPTKSPSVTCPNGTYLAMTRFLSSQKSSAVTKKGYYGDLNFLDSLNEFQLTFDTSPFMFPSSPT